MKRYFLLRNENSRTLSVFPLAKLWTLSKFRFENLYSEHNIKGANLGVECYSRHSTSSCMSWKGFVIRFDIASLHAWTQRFFSRVILVRLSNRQQLTKKANGHPGQWLALTSEVWAGTLSALSWSKWLRAIVAKIMPILIIVIIVHANYSLIRVEFIELEVPIFVSRVTALYTFELMGVAKNIIECMHGNCEHQYEL